MNDFSNVVKYYLAEGKKVESNFIKDLMTQLGGEVRFSSKNDDIYKHIDVYWKPIDKNKWFSFDVKGLRKNNRYDTNFSLETTWLEIKNVYGEPGSLKGQAHYIVFEHNKTWLIVNREKLLNELRKNVKDKTIYNVNPKTNFKMYQRKNRKDLIVRVPMSFIIENTNKIIEKT